jgi:hypothetical protein
LFQEEVVRMSVINRKRSSSNRTPHFVMPRVLRFRKTWLACAALFAVLLAQLLVVPSGVAAEPLDGNGGAPAMTRFWVFHPMYLVSDIYVYPVEYYVPETESVGLAAMEALINGMPEGTGYRFVSFPKTTKVLALNTEDGVCTVDLSSDILQANVGSSGEAALLEAIVCTLARAEKVDKVRVLVEGQHTETLAGHVDITGPLEPHWDRIYDGFEDSRQHWAGGSIMVLQSMDIMVGHAEDWTVRPDEELTRAQFVKMLAEVLELPYAEPDMPFSDMDTHWSRPYILRALAAGVIDAGDYDEDFRPDEVIPREEMAYLLVPAWEAYAEARPEIAYPEPSQVPVFSDEAEIDPKYVERVKECAALGLLTGYPEGGFGPKRGLTRGEAATVLTRLLGVSGSGTQLVVAIPRPGARQEEGPIVVLGSASAFEGTTNFRFRDREGEICFDDYTTSTHGMGFGAIGMSVDTSLLTGAPATLEVYLISMKDGSEFRRTEVPIRFDGAHGE